MSWLNVLSLLTSDVPANQGLTAETAGNARIQCTAIWQPWQQDGRGGRAAPGASPIDVEEESPGARPTGSAGTAGQSFGSGRAGKAGYS